MNQKNIIKVAGIAKVNVTPDTHRIRLEVRRTFKSNDAAYETGKKNLILINNVLKNHNLRPDLAKTTYFDVSENEKRAFDEKGRYIGYEKKGYYLRQYVYIDIPMDNKLTNELSKEIAESVPYVEIQLDTYLSNRREHKLKVMEMAVADAKQKAEILANALNCSLGSILEINYGCDDSHRYYEAYDTCNVEILPSGSPLEMTGEDEEITEGVHIIWELVKN
ncbi:MAG: SIMPL domain-containing protein [Muribaculaceae bacterium]|nr:SIMPL domain-containing protein [Muribaculaceae bacterium]